MKPVNCPICGEVIPDKWCELFKTGELIVCQSCDEKSDDEVMYPIGFFNYD